MRQGHDCQKDPSTVRDATTVQYSRVTDRDNLEEVVRLVHARDSFWAVPFHFVVIPHPYSSAVCLPGAEFAPVVTFTLSPLGRWSVAATVTGSLIDSSHRTISPWRRCWAIAINLVTSRGTVVSSQSHCATRSCPCCTASTSGPRNAAVATHSMRRRLAAHFTIGRRPSRMATMISFASNYTSS